MECNGCKQDVMGLRRMGDDFWLCIDCQNGHSSMECSRCRKTVKELKKDSHDEWICKTCFSGAYSCFYCDKRYPSNNFGVIYYDCVISNKWVCWICVNSKDKKRHDKNKWQVCSVTFEEIGNEITDRQEI
jgi:hypothetical protein